MHILHPFMQFDWRKSGIRCTDNITSGLTAIAAATSLRRGRFRRRRCRWKRGPPSEPRLGRNRGRAVARSLGWRCRVGRLQARGTDARFRPARADTGRIDRHVDSVDVERAPGARLTDLHGGHRVRRESLGRAERPDALAVESDLGLTAPTPDTDMHLDLVPIALSDRDMAPRRLSGRVVAQGQLALGGQRNRGDLPSVRPHAEERKGRNRRGRSRQSGHGRRGHPAPASLIPTWDDVGTGQSARVRAPIARR